MNSPLFRLNQVEKTRGESFHLSIQELEIHEHSVLALIGPTGAGKTTLMKLLAGAEQPSSGTIKLSGSPYDYRRLESTKQREITMVFQHPIMLTGTVRFNVEYGLRLRKTSGRHARASQVLERLGLASYADQAAHTLSGGQKQLVAIARALAVRPRILLLDEPTAHLDPARVQLVEEVIRDDQLSSGMTIVWATHQLFQARRIAHRTAFLLNGNLIESGDTKAVFSHAVDERTAAFVGGQMIY